MSVRRTDSAGGYVLGRSNAILPTGTDATVLLIEEALDLIKGEWFMDKTAGVAWLDSGDGNPAVLGGAADPVLLESEVKRTVLSVTGVSAILAFDMTFDHDTRRAQVAMTIADFYGSTPSIEVTL